VPLFFIVNVNQDFILCTTNSMTVLTCLTSQFIIHLWMSRMPNMSFTPTFSARALLISFSSHLYFWLSLWLWFSFYLFRFVSGKLCHQCQCQITTHFHLFSSFQWYNSVQFDGFFSTFSSFSTLISTYHHFVLQPEMFRN
jgi:hypothetical protein